MYIIWFWLQSPPKAGQLGECEAAQSWVKILNRFFPLSDAPTEKPDESALVIGNRDTSHHSTVFTGSKSSIGSLVQDKKDFAA